MTLNLEGNEYQIKGQNVFRSDTSLIARIVYQCSECSQLSRTIIDSDLHFQSAHPTLAGLTMADRVALNKSPYKYDWRLTKQTPMKTPTKTPTKTPMSSMSKKEDNNQLPITGLGLGVNRAMLMKNVSTRPASSGQKSNAQSITPLPSKAISVKPITSVPVVEDQPSTPVPDLYDSNFNDFHLIQSSKNLKTYSKRKPIAIIDETEGQTSSGPVIGSNLSQCKQCGKVFTKHSLSKHLALHKNPLVCGYPFCDKKFGSERELKEHIETHPKDNRTSLMKIYKCAHCHKSYVSHRELKDHSEIHINPKVCNFPDCGKKFGPKGLLRHINFVHRKDYKYKCLICNKGFHYKSVLANHKNRHVSPLICKHDGCGLKFLSKISLRRHTFQHMVEPPKSHFGLIQEHSVDQTVDSEDQTKDEEFNCKTCYRTFLTKVELDCHVFLKHRDYHQCDWPKCGRVFRYRAQLNSHKNLHITAKVMDFEPNNLVKSVAKPRGHTSVTSNRQTVNEQTVSYSTNEDSVQEIDIKTELIVPDYEEWDD